jgi:hypothetical protein
MILLRLVTRFLVYRLALTVSQTVKRNQQQYDLPLKILSYDELYGWTMDAIVEQVGRKNNCEVDFLLFQP